MKHKLAFLFVLASLLSMGQAFAVIGTIDDVPAATLLLPYFEVDIANQNGINTLFSINNAAPIALLAHVTIWSDQSVPVLNFDVYLTGYDIQTISLREVLQNGNLPQTASAGQDTPGGTISPQGPASQDLNFASCNGTLPYGNPALNAAFRAHLQAVLQGKPSPSFGTCYGSKRNDNILRGYVTVDTVRECNVFFPSQLASGYDSVLTDQNALWGDYTYVNSAQNFATGHALVHIESDPNSLTSGFHTFYGRYAGGTAIDGREALPTTMLARYLNPNPLFTGGTDFIIWREGGDQTSATSYACTRQGPAQWYPLTSTQIVIFDETEQIVTDGNIVIPNEAQRVDVATTFISPFNFGWIFLNLQLNGGVMPLLPAYGDRYAQMWLTTEQTANGRFSAGYEAIQRDNANKPFTFPFP